MRRHRFASRNNKRCRDRVGGWAGVAVFLLMGAAFLATASAQTPASGPVAAPRTSAPSGATAGGGTGSISGRVTRNGTDGIAGATVELFQAGASVASTTTNSTGSYSISRLQPGDYAAFASASGYKTFIQSPVTVVAGANTTQDFTLPLFSGSASSKEYIWAGGRLVAKEEGARTIDFEQFTGPNNGIVALPPATIGITTISGGQIFPLTINLPADPTTVYGTYGPGVAPPGAYCTACVDTITISFAQTVSNVSVFVMNGQTYNVTYTVSDDKGGQQIVTLPPNYASGAATVTLPSSGISRVTVTSNAGSQWDFFIDNISFTIP